MPGHSNVFSVALLSCGMALSCTTATKAEPAQGEHHQRAAKVA